MLSGRDHRTAFAAERNSGIRETCLSGIFYTRSIVPRTPLLGPHAEGPACTAAESAMSARVPRIEVQVQVQGRTHGEGARPEQGAQGPNTQPLWPDRGASSAPG